MKRIAWGLLLIAGCGGVKKDDAASAAPDAGKRGRAGLVFSADVIPVEAKKVDYVVAVPGVLDAFERVQVTARVAGAVDRVGFREGQEVKKGDVLVVIDAERYQVAVNSAKAALDKANAAQKDSEAMAARRQGATADHPGLIPGEELATYQTKAIAARADTEVATQSLKTSQLNLRDSSVRAPIDGVIQTRTVETGQYVQVGYVMATLLRSDPLLLRFQVEPSDAPRLKPGMIANFALRETQRQYSAAITLVGGAGDTTTHMVPVTAEIKDGEHRYWLRPGSFCDVTIALSNENRIAPTIPRAAARATDHGYVAYVVDEQMTAHEKKLTLGMNTKDGWVEVRDGIQAGDLLVVRGAEALGEGAKVRANKVNPASLAGGDAGVDDGAPLAAGDARDGGGGGRRGPKGAGSAAAAP
jgi:membrane fusion protein, multidrug efflux system